MFTIKNVSIRFKLFSLICILIICITLFVSIATYINAERVIEQEIVLSRSKVLKQISENIGMLFTEITSVSNMYAYNYELLDILKSPKADGHAYFLQNMQADNRVAEIIANYNWSMNNLGIKFNSYILSYNGKSYASLSRTKYRLEDITSAGWYEMMRLKNGDMLWIDTFEDNQEYGSYKYIFSVARLLKDLSKETPVGVLRLDISEELLYNAYSQILSDSNDIYIISRDGSIISNKNKEKIGAGHVSPVLQEKIQNMQEGWFLEKRGEDRYVTTLTSIPVTGWMIAEEIPFSAIMKPIDGIKYYTLFIINLCILLGLVLSMAFSKVISRPVIELGNKMKEVMSGNLSVSVKVDKRDEIGQLSECFNAMTAKLSELFDTVRKEEKLKRLAELDFLQAQINPHFVYNTLNSIRYMVSMNKNEEAEEMIYIFIRLLRNTLSGGSEFITVSREISNMRDYVAIQKFRYPGRFEVYFDIPEELHEKSILSMLLQPIVENAIFHGSDGKNRFCTIGIRAFIKNQEIIFEIADDGVGMREEQLEKLFEKEHKSKDGNFNRVGIINVHERIQLNYGGDYGVKVKSRAGSGTTVELRLPC